MHPVSGKAVFGRRLCVLALALIFPSTLHAASLLQKNLHYFQPPADGSGIVLTHGSEALTWLGIHWGVYADEAFEHLTVKLTDGKEETLVKNQLGVSPLFALGLSRFVNLGLALPFVPFRELNEDYKPASAHAFVVEDPRLEVKGILFDRRRTCLGLAAALSASYPVFWRENTFVSDEGLALVPRLILDGGREWWTVAFNIGYRHGPEARSPLFDNKVKNEVLGNLGAKFRPGFSHELMVDVAVRTGAADFFGEPSRNVGEAMAAYRYLFGAYSTYAITVGGGAGFLDGAGTPSVRVFLGFSSYEHRAELRK